ncbi:GlsB/YeaQ/YmgE family stress response membrane protein [Caulobacter sp. LARHSG274]
MSGVGVFVAVVIGILAGWIADLVLARRHALFTKLLIGVVGSFIGAFIAQRLDLRFSGFLGSLLVSSVGAIFFLAVLGIFSSIFRRPA